MVVVAAQVGLLIIAEVEAVVAIAPAPEFGAVTVAAGKGLPSAGD
jgi:hypothetical protein